MNNFQQAEFLLKKNLIATGKVTEKSFQDNKEQNPEMFNAMLKSIVEFGGVVKPDNLLIGKSVEFYVSKEPHNKTTLETGIVQLVFTDALASGTRDYIPVTYLLVKSNAGANYDVLPRDITKIN